MIDPNIALGVKPVQSDPMEQYGRALNLLAARQQMQMAPLRMEAAQQELEQGRLANQKLQNAMNEQQAFKEAVARGAKPAELLSIAPTIAAGHFKSLLDQRKAELDQAKQQTQLVSNALGAVKYAAAGQAPAQYQAVRADLINQGVIKPEDAPEQYDPAFVEQRFRAAIDADKQVEDQRKETDFNQRVLEAAPKSAKEWNDLILQEGSTAQSQAELDQVRARLEAMGVPKEQLARALPAMWSETAMQNLADRAMTVEQRRTAEIQRQNADTAAKNAENNLSEPELAWIAKHDPDPQRRTDADAALRRLDQSRMASRPNMTVNLPGMGGHGAGSQLSGDEYLKTLPPAMAAQVKRIAEGADTMPPANSRTQAAIDLRNSVYQYDPSFSTQRAQVRRAFTAGNDGRNIGALNTAIVHLGRLGDAAEALENKAFTPGNEVFNWFKDRFGSAAVTNFELLKDAVAGEMAAALKGNATDIEIGNMKKSIRASNSPQQMRGVVSEGMAILNDKANTYDERYHQQVPDDQWSPILPSARAQLQKHGIGAKAAGGASLPAGNGRTIDRETAVVFYNAAGGNPAKARDMARKAGWKVQ